MDENTNWNEIWDASFRIVQQQVLEGQFKAWLSPLEFGSGKKVDHQTIIEILAPNDFSAKWVQDHYHKTFNDAFSQVLGSPCQIQVKIKPSQSSSTQVTDEDYEEDYSNEPDPLATPATHTHISSGVIKTEDRYSVTQSIDPRFIFENFVVGASNQFAHASAVAVAEKPAQQYNPLFIYSAPGLGKTHLLHAIGNYLLSKDPTTRVCYVSAEGFMNELIESLQRRKMTQFREKYRNSFDVLLIDDIQFIGGKKSTEEEFFHTFNALYASKRQVVLTSDRPPKEIEKLEERIRTRFEWGLVADIQVPEIETRIAILKAKAERDDIYLPDDVYTFLASHVRSNVRELEGLLIRLQAHASLTGAEISLEMAKQELKKALPEENSLLTVDSIQEAVSKHFEIKIQDLKSSSRAKAVSLPRQIAMYLIRKYTHMGFKDIGAYFGGKDHSTILHACQKIEKSIESDPSIRDTVEGIQNLL